MGLIISAPIQTPKTDQNKEKSSVVEKVKTSDDKTKKDLEEGEQPADEIVFNKIIEGLECTPMLGRYDTCTKSHTLLYGLYLVTTLSLNCFVIYELKIKVFLVQCIIFETNCDWF